MTAVRTARVGSSPVRVVPVFAGPPGTTMTWRGVWASGATYAVLDVVRYDGSSYVCTAKVGPTATTPDTDGAHWGLMAQAGRDGIDGTGTMNGPASATDGHLAVFDGTTGKLVKDGGAVPVPPAPATASPADLAAAAAVGASAKYAREDHAHKRPTPAEIGAAAAASALGVPITDKSAAYTLAASDAGTVIRSTASDAITITVPASTFSAGQIIEVMQYGAGQVTVAAGSGVTLRTALAGLKTADQYSALSILFLSATEAVVTGDGSA